MGQGVHARHDGTLVLLLAGGSGTWRAAGVGTTPSPHLSIATTAGRRRCTPPTARRTPQQSSARGHSALLRWLRGRGTSERKGHLRGCWWATARSGRAWGRGCARHRRWRPRQNQIICSTAGCSAFVNHKSNGCQASLSLDVPCACGPLRFARLVPIAHILAQ
jgi:hypothetical protein